MPLVFLIAALILFIIAAVWNPQPAPWFGRLIAAGLACLTLAFLYPLIH